MGTVKLTDGGKMQVIRKNDKENDIIDNVLELLYQLKCSLNEKDAEFELGEKIETLSELLEDKWDRNYFESNRLSKELIKASKK